MKNTFLLFVLLLAAFSCKKDSTPEDLCEGVTCLNSGFCIDGTCSCIGLWKGKYCTEQVTPTLIKAGGISVTLMPATDNNGSGWDLTSGADIYVIIKQGPDVLLDTSTDWRQNAGVGETWTYNFTTVDALTSFSIELWDYDDFDADDYMGGVNGFIYSSTNNFPTYEPFECSGCKVGFSVGPLSYY